MNRWMSIMMNKNKALVDIQYIRDMTERYMNYTSNLLEYAQFVATNCSCGLIDLHNKIVNKQNV